MSKWIKQKRRSFLTVLLSAAIMLTSLVSFQLLAAASVPPSATAYYIADSAIDVNDRDLDEWQDVPKTYFSGSSTDYFQIMWSDNRLYFAVNADDPGYSRVIDPNYLLDQVRIGVTLPGGQTGLAFFGTDMPGYCWVNVDQDSFNSWWGETGLISLFDAADTHAQFVYEDGRVAVEGMLNFNNTYKSALAQDGSIKMNIRYYDNAQTLSSATDVYTSRVTWGGNSGKLTNSLSSFGTVNLHSDSLLEPTTAYYTADSAIDVNDRNLDEWEDVPKTYFSGSSTDYFQIMWSDNRLYFAVNADDPGYSRAIDPNYLLDQVRIGVTLPGGQTGLAFFGTDAPGYCWVNVDQDSFNGWWGETGLISLFDAADTHAQFVYEDGRAAVEGMLNFNNTYKSALTQDGSIKLAIRYYDNAQALSSAMGTYDSRVIWGGESGKLTDSLSSFGTVKLDVVSNDPLFYTSETLRILEEVLLKKDPPEAAGLIEKYPDKALDILFLLEVKKFLLTDYLQCDAYNFDKYTLPYWKGDIVYNESLNFYKDQTTGQASAPLLYPAEKILSVKNSGLTVTYEEGVDYTYADGLITLLPGSRIHCFEYDEVYFNNGTHGSNGWRLKPGYGSAYTWFKGAAMHENQVAVTYLHKGTWNGYIPSYQGDMLPNVIGKLERGEEVRIVYFGDSITQGCDASGQFGAKAPNMPIWADMVTEGLRRAYPEAKITTFNNSESGSSTPQALSNCKRFVSDNNPDLVILGYGMNDGSDNRAPLVFQNNINSMINQVKAEHSPDTDFILISTHLPNQEIEGIPGLQADYESKLLELQKQGTVNDGGIIVANMTQIHKILLTKKRYFDMTGNNINHPNDFLARAHAQVILTLLLKDF